MPFNSDTIMFHAQSEVTTVGEFHARVVQTAGWLRREGIAPADVVAVWMTNRIEWLVFLFAISRVGATLAAVNTRYKSNDVEHILSKSGARMLIMEKDFKGIDFLDILADVDFAKTSNLKSISVFSETATSFAVSGISVSRFALREEDHQRGVEDAYDPKMPSILFVTSGTTKAPKLVAHCADSLYYNATKVIESQDYNESTKLLAALPLCGVFCLMGVLTNMRAGGQTVLMSTFDGELAAQLLLKHRITHLYGSEELYQRIADHLPVGANLDFAKFYGIASFNASLRIVGPSLLAKGFPLGSLYGSSEILAYVASFYDDPDIEVRLTPGGYPIAGPEFEMRIRDVGSKNLLPAMESGALEVRSPANFMGYFNDPEATRSAFTEDGFFKTGDMAQITPDGALIYEGRIGDSYRLAGYLINSAEIEDVINSIEGVRESHFVVVRHKERNYAVAYVCLQQASRLTAEEIRLKLRHGLASYKVPQQIWIVDDFPMAHGTNGSKVQKEHLRAETLRRLNDH
ncbi:AMP-binding protein [Pusillimonas sp. ANT_WB101]|uniref:AMP-binding protein n=1 Tax=Pusillimonas sp. ANT_WB101 TaxID=2597356 RepID=UPI00165E6BD6|nr:AMP-binding protein [Pusillimonas sp. ANT_WB101]